MKCASPAVGPASSGKRPPEMPQWETTGAVQPMRSRDFITCAPGGALTTRMMASAAAFLGRGHGRHCVSSLLWIFAAPVDRVRERVLIPRRRSFSFARARGLLVGQNAGVVVRDFL